MRFTAPRSATAVALALSLAGPAPALAQEAEAALPECWAEAALPCATDTGALVETEADLDAYVTAFPAEAAAAAERAQSDGAEAPVAEEAPAAEEPAPEAAPEAAPEPTPEAAPEPTPEAAPEPEAAAPEAAPETEAPAPEAEAPDPEPAPEAAPEAEAATPAPQPEPAPEAAAPEPAPEADATAPEPAPEAAPEPEATAPEATPAPEAAAPDAAPEPAPEAEAAAPAPEPEAAPEAEQPTPEVTPEPPAEDTAAAPADAGEQGMAQSEATEPPAAAAAAPEAAPAAEVEETVVTEETARSSSEDFETAITREDASSGNDDDDNREVLQRAIAAGLAGAALAVLLNQGGQVTADSGDRLVLQEDDGNLRLFRDENALLRQPGARVRTETFDDGSTRTFVRRDDGSEVVTIRAADGTLLRRTRILPDGREVLLIDDMVETRPVEVSRLPDAPREVVRVTDDEDALREALARVMSQDLGRSFTLRQIREIDRVRYLAPEIEIDAITFASGSAAIEPDQARELAALGRTLGRLIDENPGEVFLIEGHTDAVGDASYNLALSDRRAESVALALTEYFGVPPENLVVQGYGEFDLKVPTQDAERENRRANVRRITGLLGIESAELR
jgi:outer membrane protein OmpA-like peptidoglycan-associated protein